MFSNNHAILLTKINNETGDYASEINSSKNVSSEIDESEINRAEIVPKCEKCLFPMKPHMQFFDDFFYEELNRNTTVNRYMESSDLLIVAGCDFKTAKNIPTSFLERGVPIIEINEKSIIKVGYTIHIKSSPEIALPLMLNAYQKMIKQNSNSKNKSKTKGKDE